MNCEETRRHWHLFHDSEGDAKLHHQINEHLAMCAECAGWFEQQTQLEDGIVKKLRDGEPSKELWRSIQSQCLSKQPASNRRRSFFSKLFALAACALVIVGGVVWYGLRDGGRVERDEPDLTALSVDLHEKLTTGREAIKFPSSSDIEVDEYLRSQVSFPVRCPPRGDVGFQVEGGGVCTFDNDTVAYVVGQVDGRRVSIFIMEKESLVRFPEQQRDLRNRESVAYRKDRIGVVMGEVNGNLVMILGQINEDHLFHILKSYGSYDEPGHTSRAPGQKSDSV